MKFAVPLYEFSCAFWRCVPQPLFEYEKKRRSITLQNVSYLMGLCLKLEPESVIELGTGVSTEAMYQVGVTKIRTCDREEVEIKAPASQFVAESTQFLEEQEEPADLFFIDARLHKKDVPHIKRLSKPHTVYVLDDFEGIEKGVTNALMLSDNERLLIQPVDGKYGRSTVAVLIPQTSIRLVRQ